MKHTSSISGLTKTGAIVGTIDYMAPEQIEGSRGRAPQTDVYALGCLFYHCVTGRIPHHRESEAAVLWAHIERRLPAAVEHQPRAVPAAIDSAIAKAMSKDPADRYASCDELIRACMATPRGPPPAAWRTVDRRPGRAGRRDGRGGQRLAVSAPAIVPPRARRASGAPPTRRAGAAGAAEPVGAAAVRAVQQRARRRRAGGAPAPGVDRRRGADRRGRSRGRDRAQRRRRFLQVGQTAPGDPFDSSLAASRPTTSTAMATRP